MQFRFNKRLMQIFIRLFLKNFFLIKSAYIDIHQQPKISFYFDV